MTVSVRRLERDDDRTTFHSGNVELDRFFHLYAGQNQFRHHLGTSYVAVDDEQILGFVTVTPSELEASAEKKAARPRPVLRLARLAVDERWKGRGVGSLLLRVVFQLAHRLAREVGCVGVVVDAKPDALTFYEKLGFEPVVASAGHLGDRPEPTPLFLPLALIPVDEE
jgi:predicted N-acetyltransferase YhbS